MVASITQIQSSLNFLLIHILICYCRYEMLELCRNFKRSLRYLHVIIFAKVKKSTTMSEQINERNKIEIKMP
jgi:hypothetical protein